MPQYIKESLELAIRGAAHAALLYLGANAITDGQLHLFQVDGIALASYALGGGALSLLTSAAAEPFGTRDTPTFTKRTPKH